MVESNTTHFETKLNTILFVQDYLLLINRLYGYVRLVTDRCGQVSRQFATRSFEAPINGDMYVWSHI